MELLTPLTIEERALLLREAEVLYASNKDSHSLFWLRLLCECGNRKAELALHGRRHEVFRKRMGSVDDKKAVAAVHAQGTRLRRELEAMSRTDGRVVTLVRGHWGLAWKTKAPEAKAPNAASWEMFARATGNIHYVLPSTEYFPLLNQLRFMKLAPNTEPMYWDGKESPLLAPEDVLVAAGTPENNAAIAELDITDKGVEAISLPDACGALVIVCANGREGLLLLRRAIRGPQREGVARVKMAV